MDENEVMTEMDNEQADEEIELTEDIVEEQEEPAESLDSLEEDEEEQEPVQQATEPGWIKGRISKAVQKAVAETEARMRSEFETQMAPFRERMLTDEAKELVRQGEFKSLERAKEYLQLKQGLPVSQPKAEQPRNEQGQYAPKEDPETTVRIDMLAHQADKIKKTTGIDVIAEFNSNEEIKQAVIDGEMDFYDVAETLRQPKKRPPSPMRSPNGASGNTSIADMSDEAFKRLEKRINEGARYTLR